MSESEVKQEVKQNDFISTEGRKRLARVAEWLEAGAPHIQLDDQGVLRTVEGFDMSDTITCGSSCCIAGAVCQFNKPYSISDSIGGSIGYFDFEDDNFQGVFSRAVELLGISEDDACKLFNPEGQSSTIENDYLTDPEEGARVIRTYLKTGVVTWDVEYNNREDCLPEEEQL